MYDDYHQRLLSDGTRFRPRTGNSIVEIFETQDGWQLEESGIEDEHIPPWLEDPATGLNGTTERKSILRLLICSPEQHHNDAEVLPLPISRRSFQDMMRFWHLPTEFLRMLLSTMAIATTFSKKCDETGASIEGVLLRGGRSRDYNYCVAVAFDISSGVTCAVVHGLEKPEVEKLKDCLRRSLELAAHPMLVPLILIELKIHHFAILLERRAQGLAEIEYETGMRHGFSNNLRRNPPREIRLRDRANLDFDLLTQKLTGVAGTFAFCDLTFDVGLRSLNLVEQVAEKLQRTSYGQALPGPLAQRITYLKGLIAGAQSTRRLLEQRTQAQVQTVYSLIGQKDAEAGLKDSAAMRKIAKDAKEIAVLTRRDSTDMRIIAAVTLFFLPGTFVATFFSSAFFDFPIDDPDHPVSPLIWIYWLVTGALTLIVLVAWVVFSRRKLRHMQHLMPEDVENQIDKNQLLRRLSSVTREKSS
ncbi:hypothetical protein NA57DRAFT_70047 [Rhizodiscina lignyota]|uniref:Uncharacterized protein n=1 Tax=Rhizodiscina lignyota TaxID=1504668 RepID=A0A9P4MFT3_9PEZI|nr:hypothetical protein NA57DRAFT_70047 [Rhizodiscina lignyota]